MKTCRKCNENKALDEFGSFKSKGKIYKRGDCKACARKYANDWRNSSEEMKARRRAAVKASAERHPDVIIRSRRRKAWKRLGIDPDAAEAYYLAHKGQCEICGKSNPNPERALAVDHCHTTGKIRGMLCGNCNSGIGFFKEDIEVMLKAIAYLKTHSAVV